VDMSKYKAFEKRKLKVKSKILRKSNKPRLVVNRTINRIYAQIVDDSLNKTLVSATEKDIVRDKSMVKVKVAGLVGEALAKKAMKIKIKEVVFDRRGYKYHGRIKSLAEGARKGGLVF
jgi:large subunit ribosomal protein L18